MRGGAPLRRDQGESDQGDYMRRRLTLLAVLVAAVAVVAPAAHAAPTELFFSEYIEGSSNNKALEIFNGTGSPVNLATEGYSIQMFFNGSATAGLTINLTGTVASGDVYVVAQSAANPTILAQADQTNGSGWFNGDDAVVLRKGTTVIDSIGQVGFDPGTEWGTGLTSTADNTLRRKLGVEAGDVNTTDAFDPSIQWDGFATDTFGDLGTYFGVAVQCGALDVPEGVGGFRTVSASDVNGTVTTIALDSITGDPSPGTITLTDVVPAAAPGGTATAKVNVSADVPVGSYDVTLHATNDDPAPQTGSCTLTVNVNEVKTLGEIQGPTFDGEIGSLDRSPFAPPSGNGTGQTVVVRGVITEKTLAKTSAGNPNYGFFLQSTPASTDADPLTSDGIFVFMGTFTSLIGGYVPKVGDDVVITGRVSEFFNYTELSNASLVTKVGSLLDLDAVAAAVESDPPDDFGPSERYWERLEGMRVAVPTGSVTVDGLDVFPATADAEQWLIRGDNPVAERDDPFARRVFRDAHPLDNSPGLFDDGNGYRIVLGPTGVKAAADDLNELLDPARTFDTLTNELVGAVSFTFSKYRIETTTQPTYEPGVDPSDNEPPAAADRDLEYAVNDYNVENLYDYRDDPHDGCDFTGNAGCPGVSPPFDYVPASDEVYQARLGEFADQIVNDLHAPDILLVQEAEDQDICTAVDFDFSCGVANNADGKPDTLQELAVRIHDEWGVEYDAAYDRNGADDRGIVAAFLYRADRAELLPVDGTHPVLGSSPTVDYRSAGLPYNADVSNPKSLNAILPGDVDRSTGTDGNNVYTRAPQVGWFRVWRTAIGVGAWTDLYAISEHFSSTPNARVGQRTEQARYSAAIVNALAAAEDGSRVAVGGDFNVYPRPDDPFAPPGDSDQLGPLYDEAGMHNLFDTIVAEVPAAAYSYVFQGQTQTLDGQFVTDLLHDELVQARNTHVNADFPADTPGDGARGLSDHDPLVARYELRTTVAGLRELLLYYASTGQVVDAKLVGKLLQKLDSGQLVDFAGQVRDKTPRFVDPEAAEAMLHEVELLVE
jgi:uncharacterized protein